MNNPKQVAGSDATEGSETVDPIQRPTTMGVSTRSAYDLDLRDVRGQSGARRALEIAAAGRHNVLMVGPPGCGKTMLAKRLPGLLPAADGDTECAFRAPHHTADAMAMLDGAGEGAHAEESRCQDFRGRENLTRMPFRHRHRESTAPTGRPGRLRAGGSAITPSRCMRSSATRALMSCP